MASSLKKPFLLLFCVVIAVAIGFIFMKNRSGSPAKNIRWFITGKPAADEAHRNPEETAAHHFAQAVFEKSNGRMNVEIVYDQNQDGERTTRKEAFELLEKGDFEVSITTATHLGKIKNGFWIFDMPFLFTSHAQIEKVLEGEIGEDLLAGLVKNNLRGLAFSFSGGFRILPTAQKEIHTTEDMKSLDFWAHASPVTVDMFRELGADVKLMSLQEIKATKPLRVRKSEVGPFIAGESTYSHLSTEESHVAVINETHHSVLITAMVVNEEFFQSLSPENQVILKSAAQETAREERQRLIKIDEEMKERYIKNGKKIVIFPENEKIKLISKMKPVYDKYKTLFGEDMISKIQNMREPASSN